ncbi:MAG: ATP-binding cassette domain-containing protein [Bacteroidales bacterium]|nr:ATP-binding cassette domain-containing protein [Bacteroidales bacterium]
MKKTIFANIPIYSTAVSEALLQHLMQILAFAVVADNVGSDSDTVEVFESYLEHDFGEEQTSTILTQLKGYIRIYRKAQQQEADHHASHAHIIDDLVQSINHDLEQQQKVWLMLQLLEFVGDSGRITPQRIGFLEQMAMRFNISAEEFANGKDFMLGSCPDQMPQRPQMLLISNEQPAPMGPSLHLLNPRLEGRVYVLRIESTNTLLVKYFGHEQLYINSRSLKPNRAYMLSAGAVIRGARIAPIYYNRVASLFIQDPSKPHVAFMADGIDYRHHGSRNGLHRCSFHAHAGQLIGILGGSGVGKSTLMNILNGNLRPAHGRVYINGYDVHRDRKPLEGIIGYVPQDDLLVDELTVFQNLYYNAALCFSNIRRAELEQMVEQVLLDFDLADVRHLKVGDPLNKFISGGQRKRLNMAMELMREPSVLFVDEPTSGLSSLDSERVMMLLKQQTFKGKIIFANIHQPSSETLKLFDAILVLDHGGYPIYQGNPIDAVMYFKQMGKLLNAEESECPTCGNVSTDLILKVVEARVVDEYGHLTRRRKRSAHEWYTLYLKNIESKRRFNLPQGHSPLPPNNFGIPNRWRQTWIYFRRNLLSKLANTQFIYVSLLSAPLLALIVGYFSKYIHGTLADPNAYIFSENDNLPGYLFMSIIAMVFLGLTISAEDIVKDRKTLYREKFLKMSYLSYINSKVLVLLMFSAVQSLLFVLVGNWVLEIQGLFWEHWLVLFSTAFCSNMMGLNLSAALKSVVAIYVSIPLLMVPQLLFSGVIVPYDKLHKRIAHAEYVPLVGDLMPSRWGYEALCVQQFARNRYNRHLFDLNQQISTCTYLSSLLLPKLELLLNQAAAERSKSTRLHKESPLLSRNLQIVRHELGWLHEQHPFHNFGYPSQSDLYPETLTEQSLLQVTEAVKSLRLHFAQKCQHLAQRRDSTINAMGINTGASAFELSRRHHNRALEQLVTNRLSVEQVTVLPDRVVRRYEPVYAMPTSAIGRAPLFAAHKRLGHRLVPTLRFNIAVIWGITALLYAALCSRMSNLVQRTLSLLRFKRIARRMARYLPK